MSMVSRRGFMEWLAAILPVSWLATEAMTLPKSKYYPHSYHGNTSEYPNGKFGISALAIGYRDGRMVWAESIYSDSIVSNSDGIPYLEFPSFQVRSDATIRKIVYFWEGRKVVSHSIHGGIVCLQGEFVHIPCITIF